MNNILEATLQIKDAHYEQYTRSYTTNQRCTQ